MATDGVQEGYLVLADISGYTAFLTGTELEHANAIVQELTDVICSSFGRPFRLVKLEGDAVFCYAPAVDVVGAERLLEVIELCYGNFVDRKDAMIRRTTCACAACRAIDTLDLKFLAHFGSYLKQQTPGGEDLAGPDVILVHRLLKNGVIQATGIRAYALVTSGVLGRLGARVKNVPHSESYESLGEVAGGVLNVGETVRSAREERRVRVAPEDADFTFELRMPVPPAVAWDLWNNPALSLRWTEGTTGWEDEPRPDGRMSTGAQAHCAHGKGLSDIRYLDWRPFSYVTTEKTPVRRSMTTPPHILDTAEFSPDGDSSTVMNFRIRFVDRGWRTALMARLMRPMVRRQFARMQANLDRLVASRGLEDSAPGAETGAAERR